MTDQVSIINTALSAFREGDRAKFRSMFWTPITLLLTESKAGSVFDLSSFMLGPLESWTPPELHKDGRIKVFKTMAKFQRTYQALTLSIWGCSLMGLGIGTGMDLGLVPPWKAPSYVDDNAFEEKDITIRPSYFQPAIAGTIALPKASSSDIKSNNNKLPAVLLIPGSGPIDRDETAGGGKCFRDLAHGLSSSGIITLRMDKPTSIVLLKQLITKNLTLDDEYIYPGTAALRYLSTHPAVDPSKIFILGHSLGGAVAPRLCKATSPTIPIAGLIYCASSTGKLSETIARQMEYLHSHFPRPLKAQHEKEMAQYEAVVRVVEAGGLKPGEADPTKDLAAPIPLSYLLDVRNNDPIEIARGLEDMPMLFVQGKADWQCTVEDEYMGWQTGMEGAKSLERCEWKLYGGVGHMLGVVPEGKVGNFIYAEPWHVSEEVVRDVVDFVKRVG